MVYDYGVQEFFIFSEGEYRLLHIIICFISKAELEEEISLACSVYKSMNLIWNLDHRRFYIFEEGQEI